MTSKFGRHWIYEELASDCTDNDDRALDIFFVLGMYRLANWKPYLHPSIMLNDALVPGGGLTSAVRQTSVRNECVSIGTVTSHQGAAERWGPVGPYYAMLPRPFVGEQVLRFTRRGETVLDPFCGRGTVPFAAASLGRSFFGIEIFPVGWVYSSAKCNPAPQCKVIKRLLHLRDVVPATMEQSPFFKMAYNPKTLSFLCAAREQLDWRGDRTDRTLMALILICLHDKRGAGLSNQMRQTKAFHPDYAVRWWKQNRKTSPPSVDPIGTMMKKIEWRYAYGLPNIHCSGKIYLGDCTTILPRATQIRDVKLLLTSPPYLAVTNYYADQWIRYWMLGGPTRPSSGTNAHMGRFHGRECYRKLLESAFGAAASKLRKDAVILVRTDAREYACQTTIEVLRKAFPEKKLTTKLSKLKDRLSQTALFGDKQEKPGEVDILLQ